MKRWPIAPATLLLLLSGSALALLFGPGENQHSICYGTTANGRLENGVPLSLSGSNYKSYTVLGKLLQRTYVHHKVKKVVEDSFKSVYDLAPNSKGRGDRYTPRIFRPASAAGAVCQQIRQIPQDSS